MVWRFVSMVSRGDCAYPTFVSLFVCVGASRALVERHILVYGVVVASVGCEVCCCLLRVFVLWLGFRGPRFDLVCRFLFGRHVRCCVCWAGSLCLLVLGVFLGIGVVGLDVMLGDIAQWCLLWVRPAGYIVFGVRVDS